MTTTPAIEKHYSVQQIAELWGLSEDTVQRSFRDIPGVLKISQRRLTAKARKRITLRIPESVMMKFHRDWSEGFGDTH